MVVYKKKYNTKEIIEKIKKSEKKSIDLEYLFYLIEYDPIDVYYFYINNVRGSFRYDKENS